MRLRVQIGDSNVDVGKKIEYGLAELRRVQAKQAKAFRMVRARHAPAEARVVAFLNRVASTIGYRFVPMEGSTAAVQPSAPRAEASTAGRSRPRPKAKRR